VKGGQRSALWKDLGRGLQVTGTIGRVEGREDIQQSSRAADDPAAMGGERDRTLKKNPGRGTGWRLGGGFQI